MPPPQEPKSMSLQELVDDLGLYPIEAFQFVQQGLSFTVQKLHGEDDDSDTSRHISGAQLCEGIRELALAHWGLLARTVLKRWNITGTIDFGRIVFSLVDHGFMRKTDQDQLDDFKNVYDFKTAFESEYRIPSANSQP